MPSHPTDISSAKGGAAVTASDSTVLSPTRAIWVGGAGNLAVQFADMSSAITLTGVPAGTLLPISVTKVMNTNTTATSITAIY